MSTISQIFLLFYSISFGSIFTISDRWRPFFISHSSKKGIKRLILSTTFFGLFPVVYFLVVFNLFFHIEETNFILLFLSIYAVAPLFAFYLIWVWIIIWKKNEFYNSSDIEIEPLKSSFRWIGKDPLKLPVIIIVLLIFFFIPVSSIIILFAKTYCN